MIDALRSDNGQNSSALFFLYKKLDINPVSIFTLFLISFLLVSLAESFMYMLVLTSSIIFFSAYYSKLKDIIYKPVFSFKIFLIFSFAFSYLASHDMRISLLFLLKIALLIFLSVLFNFFTDFKYLLATIDSYLSGIKFDLVKIPVRKTLFAFLLSIEFIKELFSEADGIISARKACGKPEQNVLSRNAEVLNSLLYFSFSKASEMEAIYSPAADFSEKKNSSVSFGSADLGVFLIASIEIILFLTIK